MYAIDRSKITQNLYIDIHRYIYIYAYIYILFLLFLFVHTNLRASICIYTYIRIYLSLHRFWVILLKAFSLLSFEAAKH